MSDLYEDLLSPLPPEHSRLERFLLVALLVVFSYTLLAYLVLPLFWTHYEHQKGLENLPMVTRTAQGIPGDPINAGLVGDIGDVVCAMHEAGWYPADPITLKSSIEIVGSVLLDRPYKDAPVSNLYYLGRREDLAFEKPVGSSADRRNHVRYWKVLDQGQEKRPVWLGSATLDRGVGVSKYTVAVTHHISPDLDAERAVLTADLENAGWPLREDEKFAAVVVTNYLHRPLFPYLFDALAPGGVLLYETFAVGNERFGKPSNPAFLLNRGELLEAVHGRLRVIAYQDGFINVPRASCVQRICAAAPARSTPTGLTERNNGSNPDRYVLQG